MDGCVTEEYLKWYVAYKAETNFVDIIAKASWLRLIINMKFDDLHDPKGIAHDITNKGRWGNGIVEVDIKTADEVPYSMGLIRQSLENQLDLVDA